MLRRQQIGGLTDEASLLLRCIVNNEPILALAIYLAGWWQIHQGSARICVLARQYSLVPYLLPSWPARISIVLLGQRSNWIS